MPKPFTGKTSDDRPARLLRAIPRNTTAREAIIEAGYSETTANHAAGRTVNNAIEQVKGRALAGDTEAARLLALTGISREELWARYKELALTSPSHAVSLAALAPLMRAEGLELNPKEDTKPAPQINIGIIETPGNGSVEPPPAIEHP